LILGVFFGVVYPQITPSCYYDLYGYFYCDRAFDIELLIESVIILTAIGWGIDIVWGFIRRSMANAT
jgi:hypothetical protein